MDEIGNPESLGADHDLSNFDCGEAALNSWLVRHALKNQSSNNSKTYVVATLPKKGNKVVGFYALVGASITHDQAIQSLRAGTHKNQVISAVLLARLGI